MKKIYIRKCRLAFCHIHKTGTSSIYRLAFALDYPHLLGGIPITSDPSHGHSEYRRIITEYKPEMRRKPKDTSEYIFIAFMRNPYDRVFSSYRYFLNWNKYPIVRTMKFGEFLKGELFRFLFVENPHFQSMKTSIDKMDKRYRLYRFEMFEKELGNILKERGIDVHIPRCNLPVDTRGYKDQYGDDEKNIIKEFYKWDLDNLNYSFDSYGELPSVAELKQ
ncbi:MAG: sulfotransferase family 2 domain-containing protein [Candidatus Asgardarchaeia archaeon]